MRSSAIVRTPRVLQLAGLFDVPLAATSHEAWRVDAPLDERPWSVGLIVGPSGAGKSTVARELFGGAVVSGYAWPETQSVVDGFPAHLSIKDITGLLSSVGFSSPPAWLRPFAVLSTGQQFRVTLARALAEADDPVVVDEFTSVIDRTVAQVGSAAVAQAVRRAGRRFVAVTCHYDVAEWLQPDWVLEPHVARFQWRELQRRPAVTLSLSRCGREAWTMFRAHHYLSGDLHPAARCFLASAGQQPVAFVAVLPMAGQRGKWREHRCVCAPDYQGVGIGGSVSATVAAIVRAATGGSYHSSTSHPAFIAARNRSRDWVMTKRPSLSRPTALGMATARTDSLLASFRYAGAAWPDASVAKALWAESIPNRMTQTRVSSEAAG